MSGLTAPEHLCGRMSRWTPQALRDERMTWALARAAEGWTVPRIAAALGISTPSLQSQMHAAGWRWWNQPRHIERRYYKRPEGGQA